MIVVFLILLAVAFFVGGYVGVRYVVTSEQPKEIPQVETSDADQAAAKQRRNTHPDQGKDRGDRHIHKRGGKEAAARAAVALGRQHALHHILVGAEGGHVAERYPDKCGEQCIVAGEDQLDILP